MSIRNVVKIGVLDIQGSVEEHLAALQKIGADAVAVKTKKDLDGVCGLIIPGGESTTIGKLMKKYGLGREIRRRARLPDSRLRGNYKIPTIRGNNKMLTIWGTCAGAILLAKKVRNRRPPTLNLMDIDIVRNAYGRQMDSFETEIPLKFFKKKIPAVFIRAPRVKKTSAKVKVLAEYRGEPVMLQQENLLATMFHPELTYDTTIHRYFLSLVKYYAKNRHRYRKSHRGPH